MPAVHKAWGDLSSPQLQNITSLSWESSETLPAKGGSLEKLIYIAKRSQQFASKPLEAYGVPSVSTSQIANILGLEVTGFEVTESSAVAATPAAEKSSESGTKPEPGGQPEQKPAPQPPTPKGESKPKSN